jgi:predicted DNA-binding protein
MTRTNPYEDWTTLSVAMKSDDKERALDRASDLGHTSTSAYVRELIERDIADGKFKVYRDARDQIEGRDERAIVKEGRS